MDNATKFVVHEGPCVDADQRLDRRAKVIRGEVGAVCQLDVHQAVDRSCRVSGKLDKGVQGQGEAVVQVCLGSRYHYRFALAVSRKIRLYHRPFFGRASY